MSENVNYVGEKVPARKRPRIRMLSTCVGWGEGWEVTVQMETDGELYFDDENDRWSYVEKNKEGVEFVYLRRYKP